MEFITSKTADGSVLKVNQNLLIDKVSSQFFSEITQILSKEDQVILDLSKVNFISSETIGKLLETNTLCSKNNKKIILFNLNNDLKELFETLHILDLFEVRLEA